MSLKVLPLGIIGTVLAVAGLIAYSLSPDLLWAVTIAEGLALLCLILFFILLSFSLVFMQRSRATEAAY